MLVDGVPDQFVVHDRVAVDQDVAQSNDAAEIGNLSGDTWCDPGKLVQSLTDDLELAFDRGLDEHVAPEVIECSASNEGLDVLDSISDVPQVRLGVTRHTGERGCGRGRRARKDFSRPRP